MIGCLYGVIILQAAVLSSSNILSNGLVWQATHPIFDLLLFYFHPEHFLPNIQHQTSPRATK